MTSTDLVCLISFISPNIGSSELDMSGPLLALDWGLKKVGIAKADIKGIVITPRPVWIREPAGQVWSLTSEDKKFLLETVKEEEIGLMILGDPRGPEGQPTPSSENATRFAKKLEALLNIPVILVPEQNSSWEHRGKSAEDSLVAASLLKSFFEDPSLKNLKKKYEKLD